MIGKFGKKAHFQINADYLKTLVFKTTPRPQYNLNNYRHH